MPSVALNMWSFPKHSSVRSVSVRVRVCLCVLSYYLCCAKLVLTLGILAVNLMHDNYG